MWHPKNNEKYKFYPGKTCEKCIHSRKTIALAVAFVLMTSALPANAHNINYALDKAPVTDIISYYLLLGIRHILPLGIDHILFIVSLCLLSTRIKVILWQATAFTVAHSITLALSMKNIIVVPGHLVETIISLSIMFVAIENLVISELKPWRILIVFLFGLIHGMGFASALNEIGLPPGQFYTSIISFNAGVEIGQIIVILFVFGFIMLPFAKKRTYRKYLVYPLSLAIALIAGFWTIQRIFYV